VQPVLDLFGPDFDVGFTAERRPEFSTGLW